MDLERSTAGRLHVVIGPIERWIAVICGTGLVGLIGLVYAGIVTKLDEQAQNTKDLTATVSQVAAQSAVTSVQMAALNQQLADVASMKTDVPELKVRVTRLEQDMKEQRQLTGLRR